MNEKDKINIEMTNVADDEKNKKIEEIIRERNVKKEEDLIKEAHKAVGAFGMGRGIVDAAFNGLTGVLEATSSVLKGTGQAIPIAGFVFQVLGSVIDGITALLDPKASTASKIVSLVIAAITITLMSVAFALGGVAAMAIGYIALGVAAIMEGIQFVANTANYFSLRKERDISEDFHEIMSLELKKANNPNMELSEENKINARIVELQNRVGEEKFLEKLKIIQLKRQDNLEKANARGDVEKVTPEMRDQQEKINKIIKDKIGGVENKMTRELKDLNQQKKIVFSKINENLHAGKNANQKDIAQLIKINQRIEVIEKILSTPQKLDQLYQERKDVVEQHQKATKEYLSAKGKAKTIVGSMDDLNEAHSQKLAEIDKKIEKIITPDEKLKQLYQKRKETMDNYAKDMKNFESYSQKYVQGIAEGIHNLAKENRKTLMEIDHQIEEITKPDAYLQREITSAKKGMISSAGGFVLAAAGLALAIMAAPALVAGAPVLVPVAAAIGVIVGVVGVIKVVADTVIDLQDKSAEKERKSQKKGDIKNEIVEAYRRERSSSARIAEMPKVDHAQAKMTAQPAEPQPVQKTAPSPVSVVTSTPENAPDKSKTTYETPSFRRS